MPLEGSSNRTNPISAIIFHACRGDALRRSVATHTEVETGRGSASPLQIFSPLRIRQRGGVSANAFGDSGSAAQYSAPKNHHRGLKRSGRCSVLRCARDTPLCRDCARRSKGEGVQYKPAGEYRTESQSDKPRYPTLTHSHPCWSDFVVFALQRISRSNNPQVQDACDAGG
jgi:hypothetical protein